MARIPATPRQVLAQFIDGPLAGQQRQIDAAPDGNPRPRVTLPEAPEVRYERADWGGAGDSLRYRVKPVDGHVYQVIATRWEHGYELAIEGVGVTQTDDDDPTPAQDIVLDYLRMMLDRPVARFNFDLRYPLADALAEGEELYGRELPEGTVGRHRSGPVTVRAWSDVKGLSSADPGEVERAKQQILEEQERSDPKPGDDTDR